MNPALLSALMSTCFTTSMDGSNLSLSLADFLAHPVVEVRLSPSEDVLQLRTALENLRAENTRLTLQYSQEVQICLRYEDYLRSIGVDPREVR